MTMKRIEIDIPEEIVQFTVCPDPDSQTKRNAMLVYPYIQDGTISHGKAAQMLGIRKLDLIALYGRMGLPYLDSSEEELEEDLSTLRNIRKAAL